MSTDNLRSPAVCRMRLDEFTPDAVWDSIRGFYVESDVAFRKRLIDYYAIKEPDAPEEKR